MSSRPSQRYDQVGLDRLVRLKWLKRTASLVLAGNEAPAVKIVLQEELRGAFHSTNTKTRGSLDKTLTILMKIWARPPHELRPLWHDGLELLLHLPREHHIAVHWGMTMAVYPFWGTVAAHVGRLLRLQGTAAASQVQRRVREQYGERETVSRRVRYVLRSFVDWGVLKETSEKGIYTSGLLLHIVQAELIAWLAEAFLHAHRNGSVALQTVLDSTNLFPFRLSPIPADRLVTVSRRLEVLRHSLDQELIMLRKESLAAAKSRG